MKFKTKFKKEEEEKISPAAEELLNTPALEEEDDEIPMSWEEPAPPVELDELGLPKAPTRQKVNPLSLRYLFVAPPGFGKTTTFSLFPDSILLACEEGHKFVNCTKIIIDRWAGKNERFDQDGNLHLSFLEAIRRIVASDRFRFVVIDTADALVKLCTDYYLEVNKAEHPTDLGEYGKGWDKAQNSPVRKAMNILLKTGRGIGYTTHQEIKTNDFKDKKTAKVKKETTLPNGIMKILFPQVEAILHGEFGKIRKGNKHRDRIIRTEGSEELLAKNRGGVFPPAFILPPDESQVWPLIESFFQDKSNADKAYAEYLKVYGKDEDEEESKKEEKKK